MIRVRFAPSPTGLLHLGNARTAMLNALFAKHHHGTFILRMDDTDIERNRAEYKAAIQEDLHWLGLDWDETFSQSQRTEVYQVYFKQLVQSGRIYPCFETSEQLEIQRQEQLAKNLPPIYDRAKGRSITPHHNPYWRFSLTNTNVSWDDAIQGPMAYHAQHLSDPVVMRQDGSMSYLLSSVIDDVDMKISHILRGADHLTNTAIQIQMILALHADLPVWAHFPLMFNEHGEKFSKRAQSLTIQELRQQEFLPLAIVQALAQLGLSHMVVGSFSQIASQFSLEKYSKSNAKFSIQDIEMAQSRLWASMTYTDLPQYLREQISEPLWFVVRDNIVIPADIPYWQSVCSDNRLTLTSCLDSSLPENFLALALQTIESSCAMMRNHVDNEWIWSKDAWHIWIDSLSQTLPNIKRGLICKTLRMCLTGRSGGPKMDLLLPVIKPCIATLRMKNTHGIHTAP